jgi:hypothetical protein
MRRRSGVAMIAAIGTVSAALAAGLTLPAHAVQPVDLPVVANADPVGFTPHVLDGQVRAIAEVGGITLVGGTFTKVRDAFGGPVLARSNLFAYTSATGRILTGFAPVAASTVYAIEPSGDGTTAYVGGRFSNMSGAKRTKRLVRMNATTGITDPAFRSPGFDGTVKNVVLRNGLLYVGGNFRTVGAESRTLLTAVDPSTGTPSSKVALTFSQARVGSNLQVIAFDITPDGSQLYAAGNFTKVEGLDRVQVVKIDLTTTPATVADWQTTRYTTPCSSSFPTYIRDLDISSDGSYFVIGTTGSYGGGIAVGSLCDGIARWETGRSGSGQQPTWVDYTGGDTLWSVAAGGETVYAGGHFRWFNNPYAADAAGPGAVYRPGIAALDPRNGLPLTWNPTRSRGVGAFDLVTTARGLYVGSDTDRIGRSEYHARVALLPVTGGAALPPDVTGTLPGKVYSLGHDLGDTVTARSFDGTTVTSSEAVSNGGNAFREVRGAFIVDGKLYTGLVNGTLQVRSFDGTTFGAPSTVNLNRLTDFSNEIRNITGMFFDAATGRLYFTLAGSSALYYRYFTPESQLVGAVRFTAQDSVAGGGGVNWSQVSSMFQAGQYLYVALASDGSLRRYTWDSAAGTVAADGVAAGAGQNWKARGAFIYGPATSAAPQARPR